MNFFLYHFFRFNKLLVHFGSFTKALSDIMMPHDGFVNEPSKYILNLYNQVLILQ